MGTKTGTKRLFPDGKRDPRKRSGKTQNHFRFVFGYKYETEYPNTEGARGVFRQHIKVTVEDLNDDQKQ